MIEARYLDMFGSVPANIRDRLKVAEAAGRTDALLVLEEYRRMFLDENALEPRVQRLVHFGMTLAAADRWVVESHARSAMRSGATVGDLLGVCETAAVVLGMPAYSRGVDVLADLLASEEERDASAPAVAR